MAFINEKTKEDNCKTSYCGARRAENPLLSDTIYNEVKGSSKGE